jgi:hypothetical protein
MKAMNTKQLSLRRSLIRLAFATVLILLVPLIAMQFSDEVNWSLMDFVVAGSLLFGTGLIYALATRTTRSVEQRVVIGTVVVTALVLVWVQLAVGIFD